MGILYILAPVCFPVLLGTDVPFETQTFHLEKKHYSRYKRWATQTIPRIPPAQIET